MYWLEKAEVADWSTLVQEWELFLKVSPKKPARQKIASVFSR